VRVGAALGARARPLRPKGTPAAAARAGDGGLCGELPQPPQSSLRDLAAAGGLLYERKVGAAGGATFVAAASHSLASHSLASPAATAHAHLYAQSRHHSAGARHGLRSGCYPLDDYYKSLEPEAAEMKKIKQRV
jgi:hypothetical protein